MRRPGARKLQFLPTLRYADPAAVVPWLCRAFAFTEHLGAREYSWRDPEGYVWCFGNYSGES
jgi:hypothetical protein